MTLPKSPVLDLTTPIHDMAFRVEANAMWRVGKDTAEWGAPWWLGGGVGVIRWGDETIFPLYVQILARPFKQIDRLRLDVRLGGAFGPWKTSAQGHVAIGMINECGLRYRFSLGRRMALEPRFHFGLVGVHGPMRILEEETWKDVRRQTLDYIGAGVALTF